MGKFFMPDKSPVGQSGLPVTHICRPCFVPLDSCGKWGIVAAATGIWNNPALLVIGEVLSQLIMPG